MSRNYYLALIVSKRHKKPRCASTGSFFKYISFYYFLFTKYFFISLNSFLLFFFPLCYGLQIGLTCFALHGIYDVDTAVAHSVNMVDNAVVWLGKFCLAFSFTDTFYMGFSHLDTKILRIFSFCCRISFAASVFPVAII